MKLSIVFINVIFVLLVSLSCTSREASNIFESIDEGFLVVKAGEFNNRDVPATSGGICPEGGEIVLDGFGKASFAPNTFTDCTTVSLRITSDKQVAKDFQVTTQLFYVGPRDPVELIIDTGRKRPRLPVRVERVISKEFLELLPENAEIQGFVQFFQDQGGLLRDSFELVPASINLDKGTVAVNVPRGGFTQYRNSEQSFETIFVVGSTLSLPDSELGVDKNKK